MVGMFGVVWIVEVVGVVRVVEVIRVEGLVTVIEVVRKLNVPKRRRRTVYPTSRPC